MTSNARKDQIMNLFVAIIRPTECLAISYRRPS